MGKVIQLRTEAEQLIQRFSEVYLETDKMERIKKNARLKLAIHDYLERTNKNFRPDYDAKCNL